MDRGSLTAKNNTQITTLRNTTTIIFLIKKCLDSTYYKTCLFYFEKKIYLSYLCINDT